MTQLLVWYSVIGIFFLVLGILSLALYRTSVKDYDTLVKIAEKYFHPRTIHGEHVVPSPPYNIYSSIICFVTCAVCISGLVAEYICTGQKPSLLSIICWFYVDSTWFILVLSVALRSVQFLYPVVVYFYLIEYVDDDIVDFSVGMLIVRLAFLVIDIALLVLVCKFRSAMYMRYPTVPKGEVCCFFIFCFSLSIIFALNWLTVNLPSQNELVATFP